MSKETTELRKILLSMSNIGRDGNLQSCFSSLEILWTLYDKILNIGPDSYRLPERDRFVLSKGQSTAALLAVLAKKGFLPESELRTFCQYHSRISMQADRTKLPFVEISAGSLGHGLPMAVGMAWGAKIRDSSSRVYALVGDGEMNEGTMWEAALFAASEKLGTLTVIIDDNDSIGRMIHMGSLECKLRAFEFDTVTVDGHDEAALEQALTIPHNRPLAVIAKTVRGYGCKTLMHDRSWFHRYPKNDELPDLLCEVDQFAAGRGTEK
ncbi:MAG: hypothetical protein K2O45_10225 [Oscillospiraceae bacterium]|nr:hypothetical protein [Oscillospiraceae bacterium]